MRCLKYLTTSTVILCLAILPAYGASKKPVSVASFPWQEGEVVKKPVDGPIQRYNKLKTGFYTILPDGMGYLDVPGGGWDISCKKDLMTDARDCFVMSMSARIAVFYGTSDEPRFIKLLGHNYPGTIATLRLDDNTPITSDESGLIETTDAYAQLKGAKMIKTRIIVWPTETHDDQTAALIGYNDAVSLMKHIRNHIDGMDF